MNPRGLVHSYLYTRGMYHGGTASARTVCEGSRLFDPHGGGTAQPTKPGPSGTLRRAVGQLAGSRSAGCSREPPFALQPAAADWFPSCSCFSQVEQWSQQVATSAVALLKNLGERP